MSLWLGLTWLSTAALATEKRILLLTSYSHDALMEEVIQDELHKRLNLIGHVLHTEHIDAWQEDDLTAQSLYRDYLQHKLFRRGDYAAVLLAGEGALQFWITFAASLLPDRPVIFLGVNALTLPDEKPADLAMTGILEPLPLAANIELSARLFPERPLLQVVTDASAQGQRQREALKSLQVDGEMQVLSLAELSWQALGEQLYAKAGQSRVLVLSASETAWDAAVSFDEGLRRIRRSSNAPIFSLWEVALGHGVLGGAMISHREQARLAAEMTMQVLSGIPVSELPMLRSLPTPVSIDYRELQRLGLPRKLLPEGTQLVFRSESFWQRYQRELGMVVFALMALSLLSIWLTRQNLQRQILIGKLNQERSFLASVMDAMPELVWLKDTRGRYLSCNRQTEITLGLSESKLQGHTDHDLFSRETFEAREESENAVLESRRPRQTIESWGTRADDPLTLEVNRQPFFSDSGELLGILAVARDISNRMQTEQELHTLSLALEQSPVSVMITDPEGRMVYVNQACEIQSGYTRNELLGRTPAIFSSGETPRPTYESLWATIAGGQTWEGELLNRRKSGQTYWEHLYITPVLSPQRQVLRYVAVKEDITERKATEKKLYEQARFDPLTNLPNRTHALEYLQRLLQQAKRRHDEVAILFIDLDHFKNVNDSLGHDVGDRLLVEAGRRLQASVRQEDLVGRLGGDEFIVLLGGLARAQECTRVATKILNNLKEAFEYSGRHIRVSASIGISVFPEDGDSVSELLRRADAAMFEAKRAGRAEYAYFTSELNQALQRRFTIEEQLHGALGREEFSLQYQPQIDLKQGRIVGIEALIRWHNPVLGFISPAEFIPIAEQSGHIIEIGRFVLETGLRMLAQLQTKHELELVLAVNLSPQQLRDRTLLEHLQELLTAHKLPAHLLELEITEGVLVRNSQEASDMLTGLHKLGLLLAMDDFGTGYSSLTYLRNFPFDRVKIDRSFVSDIIDDPADQELVQATLAMAHGLGLEVVAEGVETQEQAGWLMQHDCEMGQGYYFSKPLPSADLIAYLQAHRQAPTQAGQWPRPLSAH